MPSSVAKICLAVVLLVVSASTIAAHSGATGVVKERMMLMKQMAKDTKALAKMAFGKTAYDAAAVRQHAGEIEKRAGAAMTELFPAGSEVAPSEANADIWRSWDKFTAIAAELESAASAMAAGADQGPAAAKAAFGRVAGTCKACHSAFRK
ncbi:MAG: cytochrome c [Pseudomonadota bacterium]|nr:cytochrome c [Pseudomonadota bacterium]